ncbi:MAG: 2-C-methyl-D-erythritol 4-phosphate cytidylyltransferase [Thermomicrobiales bacterium]
MTAAAIVVAGGSGQRFGNAGKSFAMTNGMPMAWWSLAAAANATLVDEIVLVCGEHSQAAAGALLSMFDEAKPITLALGGVRRQDSARAGLCATSDDVDVVAIHDAARPLVTADLLDLVIETAREHGAVITAVPVSDTIKRVQENTVLETVPRHDLVAVQTPQAFRKHLLLEAFAAAESNGTTVTDEASLVESLGHAVHVIPGRNDNIKVTYPADLHLVQALFEARTR